MIWVQILKTVGVVVGGVVSQLLAGKAVKRLIILPFEWIARKTKNTADDKLVKDAEKDLGLEE